MSQFDLHEFNILSKRHNYFMTNNRLDGFPFLNENSIFLKKILFHRTSNSSDKRLEMENNNNYKPKKFVRFAKPENIPYKNIYQSPIIIKNKPNNSNDNLYRKRYHYNPSNNNLKNIPIGESNKINISPYRKNILFVNKKINRPNYYRIPINNQSSPINSIKHHRFHSNSNINDYKNDMLVISFKGKKIFSSNSFRSLKSSDLSNSPGKSENSDDVGTIKESELFRNTEELQKKKEEIFLRKMKRESSSIRREILRKEKDKDIKEKKISIEINSNNNSRGNSNSKNKNENKMRIIPINRGINNIKKKIKRFIPNINNMKNNNSFNISIKSGDKILLNNIKNNNIKRINNSINNDRNNLNDEAKNDKEKETNTSNNNIESIIRNNNFKSNNIYLSKFSERTPPKNNRTININNKIKENLEFLRQSKNSEVKNDKKEKNLNINNNKTKSLSPDKPNNPYRFMTSKKKFCEDYIQKIPTLYSNDKKISIKISTLPNLNEIFLGKKQSKEKLKMQRVISVTLKDNIKTRNRFSSYKNYQNIKKIRENKSLRAINEEEEKVQVEPKFRIIKTEENTAIKEKKPRRRIFKNENKVDMKEEKQFRRLFKNENKVDIKDEKPFQKIIKNENKVDLKEEKPFRRIIKNENKVDLKEEKPKFRRFKNQQKNEVKEEKPKENNIKNENKIEIKEEKSKYKRFKINRKVEEKEEKPKSKIFKAEEKIEIKVNPPLEKNIRKKYIRRFENRK